MNYRSPLLILVAALSGACTFNATGLGENGSGSATSSDTDSTTGTDSTTTMGATTQPTTSVGTVSETGTTTDSGGGVCGDGVLDAGEACDNGADNGSGKSCKADCTANICGDGDKGPGEGCDDGNVADGDGCSSSCVLESCGNGMNEDGEECDDGNDVNDDGCTNACTLPACGDGILQAANGEACDNGANNGPGKVCNADCTANVCGDGDKSPNEGCDDGNNVDGDGCSATCTSESCGDGELQPGEECDDGNKVNDDGCTNLCTLPACGDGILQGGEECDDGGDNGVGKACKADCTDNVCGDGDKGPDEECDDGNDVNTDNCTNVCELAACGDGFIQGDEECDDGNNIDDDACSNSCMAGGMLVFVTSGTWKGDLGGLAGADAKCAAEAQEAGLDGVYMAWLSSNAEGPSSRFLLKANVAYILVDGTKIADNWGDLISGSIQSEINLTAGGQAGGGPVSVYTNTATDGAPKGGEDCAGWTNQGGGKNGGYGERNQTDQRWTDKDVNNCGNARHLYCFQQ